MSKFTRIFSTLAVSMLAACSVATSPEAPTADPGLESTGGDAVEAVESTGDLPLAGPAPIARVSEPCGDICLKAQIVCVEDNCEDGDDACVAGCDGKAKSCLEECEQPDPPTCVESCEATASACHDACLAVDKKCQADCDFAGKACILKCEEDGLASKCDPAPIKLSA